MRKEPKIRVHGDKDIGARYINKARFLLDYYADQNKALNNSFTNTGHKFAPGVTCQVSTSGPGYIDIYVAETPTSFKRGAPTYNKLGLFLFGKDSNGDLVEYLFSYEKEAPVLVSKNGSQTANIVYLGKLFVSPGVTFTQMALPYIPTLRVTSVKQLIPLPNNAVIKYGDTKLFYSLVLGYSFPPYVNYTERGWGIAQTKCLDIGQVASHNTVYVPAGYDLNDILSFNNYTAIFDASASLSSNLSQTDDTYLAYKTCSSATPVVTNIKLYDGSIWEYSAALQTPLSPGGFCSLVFTDPVIGIGSAYYSANIAQNTVATIGGNASFLPIQYVYEGLLWPPCVDTNGNIYNFNRDYTITYDANHSPYPLHTYTSNTRSYNYITGSFSTLATSTTEFTGPAPTLTNPDFTPVNSTFAATWMFDDGPYTIVNSRSDFPGGTDPTISQSTTPPYINNTCAGWRDGVGMLLWPLDGDNQQYGIYYRYDPTTTYDTARFVAGNDEYIIGSAPFGYYYPIYETGWVCDNTPRKEIFAAKGDLSLVFHTVDDTLPGNIIRVGTSKSGALPPGVYDLSKLFTMLIGAVWL